MGTKQRDPTRYGVCHGSTWTDALGGRAVEREVLTVRATAVRMPIDRDDDLSVARAKRRDRARRLGACGHHAAIIAATISEIGGECHAAPVFDRHPQEPATDIVGRYAEATHDALVLIACDAGL